MKSVASISKDLLSNNAVNTEVSEVHSHQPEASLASSCTVNDPPEEFKEFMNGKLLALTKEFNANLTIVNKTLLEHSIKLNNFIPQDSERAECVKRGKFRTEKGEQLSEGTNQ